MRYIKLLIGFLFLFSLTFAQKQTYGDFRAQNDKRFQTEFKNNSENEQLLKEYKYYQRFTWFWDSRVSHDGLSDNYFLELNKFILNKNELKSSVPFSSENTFKNTFWEIIGPNSDPQDPFNLIGNNNIGIGRIDAIWVDPSNNNHLLIGAYGGGLWETNNGGSTWTCLTEDLHTLTVNQIEVIDGIIYLSCGFEFGSRSFSDVSFGNLYGLGVIKSTDWGDTWIVSNNFSSKALTYCESDSDIMYSIDPTTIYKSINGGDSWLELNTFSEYNYLDHGDTSLNDIIVHPIDSEIVYIVAERGNGSANMVHRSDDGGDTWESEDDFNTLTNFPNHVARGGSFYYNDITNKLYLIMLYVIIEPDGDVVDRKSIIFESSDWINWQRLAGDGLSSNYATYADIQTNLDGSKIYQLGVTLRDRTGGSNTSISSGKIHDDIRAIAFSSDNSIIFAGHDGGISKTINNGQSWTNINGNLNLNLSYEMGYYSDLKGSGNRWYDIGTQDTGWYRNIMDGTTPRYATHSWEGSVYTSPHKDKIYFKTSGTTSHPISISEDGGDTKQPLMNGVYPMKQTDFTSALIEDPVDSKVVFVNNGVGLIRNNNFDVHPTDWDDISPPTYNLQRSYTMNVPHSNNNVIYYVSTFPMTGGDVWIPTAPDNIIWKSVDQGLTWCNITNNLTSYFQGKYTRITEINSDSFNPDRVWISVGGISEDGSHVYYSSNGGQSWGNITHNLPNLPINTIEYDENRKILFVGTDYGVYYLDGSTWKEYGNDLPKAIVTNIFVDDLYNEILVSVFGRGAWKAPLDICSDEVIYANTVWNGHKTICGDLIVKTGNTLTINNSNISAQNIIIEPGAKIIWNGGNLSNTSGSSIKVAKGVCALYNGSLLRLNNVTINNYNIEARQESTVSLNIASLVASSINLNNKSYFHIINGTSVALDLNSSIHLEEGFVYGFHTSLSLVNTFARNFANINMTGLGFINGYDKEILYVQNQNFQNGNYNLYSNEQLLAGYNVMNTTTVLPGNFKVQNNVKMKMEAGESILLDVGSEITNSNFLAQINPQLAEPPICHPSLPPNSTIKEKDEDEEMQEKQPENSDLTKTISVFPNPSTGIFNYKLNNIDVNFQYTISIYDLTGNLIQKFNNNKQEGKVDLSNHKSGTYALVIEMKDKTEKLLIIKN